MSGNKKNMGLIRRFIPYFKKYKWVLVLDLFCAALTTICELVLPLIVQYITDMGTVSYTHLDVYKRQAQCWALFPSIMCWGIGRFERSWKPAGKSL